MHIRYFLLVPPEQDTVTPFQGFNLAVTDKKFASLMWTLAHLPNHAREIFLCQKDFDDLRLKGFAPKDICTVRADLLCEELISNDGTLNVFACMGGDVKYIIKATKHLDLKPIVISASRSNEIKCLENPDYPNVHLLDREIRRAIVIANAKTNEHKKIPDLRKPYTRKLNIPETGGGAIIANELFLRGLGYQFSGRQDLPCDRPETYRDIVYETAKLTLSRLPDVGASREFIIYAPGILPALYDTRQYYWNNILRNIKEKLHRDFITDGIIKNPSYSAFTLKDAPQSHPFSDPTAFSIIRLRQREFLTTNLAIGLLATSTSAIPIRLPNAVNLHFKQLKQMEDFSRRGDSKAEKLLQNSFKELNKSLRHEFGPDIRNLINDHAALCTICSDFPLEWMYLDRLPLMISHQVSKIPMTPGNMLLQHCSVGHAVTLSTENFAEILVIRSFKDHDPLRHFLETAIDGYPISQSTSVRFVDVQNNDEVIAAMNAFDGAVVIFDCHGLHGGPEDVGWLAIGDEKLITWELAHQARVPPIVLLSSCLTSAVGGSHASVANGLLRSGALSVISTFLPVNGIQSAIFMARIVYRIDAFIPVLKNLGFKATNWRTFISTFLRMSYLTDFLRYFEQEELIDASQFKVLHMNGNMMINLLRTDWFDETLTSLATVTGKSEAELLDRIHNNRPFLETMIYCQQGRPDLISIRIE